MASERGATLSQEDFDDLYGWLQEHCNARYTRSGLRYTCTHTFEHTRRWLQEHHLDVESYLTHLQRHHLSCDCAILRELTDWPQASL